MTTLVIGFGAIAFMWLGTYIERIGGVGVDASGLWVGKRCWRWREEG